MTHEQAPTDTLEQLQVIDDYWHAFAETLLNAEPGTEAHRIAWRNYMTAVYCKADELQTIGNRELSQSQAINIFYNEGLQTETTVFFMPDQLRYYRRVVFGGIVTPRREPLPTSVELLQGLHEGRFHHALGEE